VQEDPAGRIEGMSIHGLGMLAVRLADSLLSLETNAGSDTTAAYRKLGRLILNGRVDCDPALDVCHPAGPMGALALLLPTLNCRKNQLVRQHVKTRSTFASTLFCFSSLYRFA
jgi:hypothetical protein